MIVINLEKRSDLTSKHQYDVQYSICLYECMAKLCDNYPDIGKVLALNTETIKAKYGENVANFDLPKL